MLWAELREAVACMGAALLGLALFAGLAGGTCAALYGLLTLAGALG